MRWLTKMRLRLRSLFRRAQVDRELDAELQFYVDHRTDEHVAAGMDPTEARAAAFRSVGSVIRVKEAVRETRGLNLIDEVGRELLQATRRLVQSPGFTLTTVLTLALAIGANAAIFTVVHRVLLNSLPYPDSDRLIDLDHAAPGVNAPRGVAMTIGLYYHYQERARTLDGIAIHDTAEATLTGNGTPERIRLTRATLTLSAVLRVSPMHGRWFTEEEGGPGGSPVAVLSHGLWMRRFGGNPGILGRPVTLDGIPTEVIGVMPASFTFPDPRVDGWIPRQMTRRMVFDDFSYSGVARLRDGVSVSDARAELTGLIAELPSLYADNPSTSGLVNNARLTSVARTLRDATVGDITGMLWILLASVGVVLLVACANVMNLFLVRSEARQREIAVRRALGAGRAAVARFFAAESALISVAGGAIGLAVAWSAVRLLVGFSPANLPRLEEVRLDGIVVVFTVGLTILAALAFGAIPLLRAAPVASSLHERGRGNTASGGRHRVRHVLLGGQVALALVLLVSSGLMIRSFHKLRAIDPGFDATSALTFRIGLPDREYPSRLTAVAAHHAILDRLSVIPGVTSASLSTRVPLADAGRGFSSFLRIEGRTPPERTVPPIVAFRAVAGGYVETMGMRLLRGRGIDRSDVERSELVAVVNEALAKVYFPGQDPIGARIARGTGTVNSDWLTIVGVVSNTPIGAIPEATEATAMPELYLPMSVSGRPETPGKAANGPPIAAMSYVMRSHVPPLGLLPSVRRALDEVDANVAIAQVRTLQDLLDGAAAQMAFTMVLLGIAASVALLLGLVGIYGVVSYVVSQRTNEIGVRLALGAEPGSVAGMIVRQGGLVALAGVTVGLAAALIGSRLIESLLYDVSPRDPGVFIATTLTLLGVSILACYLPARRAARVDPLVALRYE